MDNSEMPSMFFLILCAAALANAQSNSNPGIKIGPIDRGLVIGIGVGAGVVIGGGVTYLVLHNRGVVTGCVDESGGKRTLLSSGKKVYSLVDGGPDLPLKERLKVKGHQSGAGAAPSFRVEKILKDYGRCRP